MISTDRTHLLIIDSIFTIINSDKDINFPKVGFVTKDIPMSWWQLHIVTLSPISINSFKLKWFECFKRIMCEEVGLFRSGGDKVCVGLSGSRGERGGASSVPVSLQDNWFPPPPRPRRLLSSCPLIRKCYDYVYHWSGQLCQLSYDDKGGMSPSVVILNHCRQDSDCSELCNTKSTLTMLC